MTALNKRITSYTIKLAIVALAFWYIFKKVFNNQDLKNFTELIYGTGAGEIILILTIVVLFMFANWGFEVLKWQRLIWSVEKISIWRAIESVCCGLTLAIFTPSRIGEYGGRVFFLSPKRRIIGVVAMTVGGVSQLMLTHVFGCIAGCIFLYRFIELKNWAFILIVLATLAYMIFWVVFYFNIHWIKGLLLKIKWMRKYEKFYEILGRYQKTELFRILLFSLARYSIFTTQYVILLLWLTPDLHVPDMVMMMCIIFLIQSVLPSLDILDVGVRSLTASFFFGYLTNNNLAVIAVASCIWFVNIIIPAILGSYFVFKLNFFGTDHN